MQDGKTSTFTIHHDRCKPEAWTAGDILTFASFVCDGNLQCAAHLSRLGVQLVLSEHHEPKGGVLEQVGWAPPDNVPEISDDLMYCIDDRMEVVELVRVYRGPVEYAVCYPLGDEEGNIDGYDVDIKPTHAEAEAFLKSLYEQALSIPSPQETGNDGQ